MTLLKQDGFNGTKTARFPSLGRRVVLVTVACLQNIFAAGIVYGWASVAGSLLVAPFSDGGAALTLDQTTSIFSIAASVSFISSLFLGMVLDCCGPRICSVLSHAIIAAGCQVFASAKSYPGFAVGACLMAFGGPGIPNSVVHLANVFPNNRFLVMTSITGTITLSFSILSVFDLLWSRYDIGFRSLFSWYNLVIVMSGLGALVLWPDTPYEADDFASEQGTNYDETALTGTAQPAIKENFVSALVEHEHLIEQPLHSTLRVNEKHKLDRHSSYLLSREAIESGNTEAVAYISLKDLPFRSQVTSGCFWRITLLFMVFSFCANLFVASINVELEDTQFYSELEQHQLAWVLTSVMSFGILASPPVGWLMDITGWESCTILTIVVSQVHMLILVFFFSHKTIMIVGFIVYMLFRQLLFPVFLAALTERLGFKYFGILSGLGYAISGVAQLLMEPVVQLVQGTCHLESNGINSVLQSCTHGNWQELHIVQFGFFCLLIQVPLLDYRIKVQRERKMKEALGIAMSTRQVPLTSYGAIHEENEEHL